jgi:hypothetical protein
MKTAMKITAIAVITVLVALSCVPEVDYTRRDYSEYKDQFDAKYTDNQQYPAVTGTFAIGVIASLKQSNEPLADNVREIKIIFPEDADVLKVSNDKIVAEIEKFLNFYTYTNPTPAADAFWTPSELRKIDVAKTFVSRESEGYFNYTYYQYYSGWDPDAGEWVDTSHRDTDATPYGYRFSSISPTDHTITFDVSYSNYQSAGSHPVYKWIPAVGEEGEDGYEPAHRSDAYEDLLGYNYTADPVDGVETYDISLANYSAAYYNPVYPWVESGEHTGAYVDSLRSDSGYAYGQPITIRLASVPNAYSIVWELDTSAYLVNGQKLDMNGDGKVGEGQIWDKQYGILPITSTGITPAPTDPGPFVGPVPEAGPLYIQFSSADYLTAGDTHYQLIAGFGFSDAVVRTFLGEIKDRFELQKYDGKTWVPQSEKAVVFNSDTAVPTDVPYFDDDCLYIAFKPENFGIYRLVANRMKDLRTLTKIGKDVVKIPVCANSEDPTFLKETFYLGPEVFTQDTVKWVGSASYGAPANPFGTATVTSDANKKNVVLELRIASISTLDTDGFTTKKYAEELDKDAFIKTVKLVYKKNAPYSFSFNSLTKLDDLVEIKIDKVEYKADKRFDSDVESGQNNLIRIFLDPSYQISQYRDRELHLLVTTGFTYKGDKGITFGSPENIFPYAGSFFWADYKTISGF